MSTNFITDFKFTLNVFGNENIHVSLDTGKSLATPQTKRCRN